MLFQDVIDMYLDKDPCDLSHNQLVELSDSLKSIQSCHLENIDDHKTYLLLLRKYRVAVLLTENRTLRTDNIFISDNPEQYYNGELIPSHIIAKSCEKFAEFIGCFSRVNTVTYEQLKVTEPLTADDIESLYDDSIFYGLNILKKCRRDGYITDELNEVYGPFDGGTDGDGDNNYDFPIEIVKGALKVSSVPREIIVENEIRKVAKIVLPNGNKQLLTNSEAHANLIDRYRPDGHRDICFCQMCRKPKNIKYIEVNSLVLAPKYYWPQLHMCFCLECSKRFEEYRRNERVIQKFYDGIAKASIHSDVPIEVVIDRNPDNEKCISITFTQKHLAEIQEILKTNKI